MTPWLKRALIRGLMGPAAYGVVSILVCLFYVWMFGGFLGGGNSSNDSRVYKNYTGKLFIEEIMADKETAEKRAAKNRNILSSSQSPKEGTFVVIPISGPIFGENAQRMWDQLYIAARITRNTKAIIFLVNSPGGGVTESDYLYEEIRRIKSRGIKIVTFVVNLSASGAYYMTAQSDRILVSPTAIVGSIGVIWDSYNVEELIRKLGVSIDVIKSSEMKDIGSPFKKMSNDEKTVLRKIVGHSYGRFKLTVQKGRGMTDSQVELVSTGEVWHAEDARKLNLVDGVGYVNSAIDVAMELTGVNVPTVIQYEEEVTFWDIFGVNSPVVGLIRNFNNTISNPSILTPRMLYMWIP